MNVDHPLKNMQSSDQPLNSPFSEQIVKPFELLFLPLALKRFRQIQFHGIALLQILQLEKMTDPLKILLDRRQDWDQDRQNAISDS